MISGDIQTSKYIFAYMLKNPDYLMNVHKGFFRQDDLQLIAMTAKSFFNTHRESPSCEQMKLLLKDVEGVTPEAIDDYYDVDITPMDPNWIKNTVEGWIKMQSLIKGLSESGVLLKTTDVTYENSGPIVEKVLEKFDQIKTITFDDNIGYDFFNIENHKNTKEEKIPFTWEFWNKSSDGGLDPKTLTSYLGSTNIGKSIILCNDAAEFVRKGKNVLFVTCEMSYPKIFRRIAANLYNMNLEDYDKAIQTGKLKRIVQEYENRTLIPHGKLWVKEYPTGECTSIDLESQIKKYQEVTGIKIDAVIIDYINIMCNYRNPNSENTYLKIKSLAEDLRAIAIKYDLLVITASQIGRNALNSSDVNIEDISESMGLAHTCDSIIGIIQTEEMRIGEIDDETGNPVPYYWLKILKIREGKNKGMKFRVNINYNKMKLIEKIDDMDTFDHFKTK